MWYQLKVCGLTRHEDVAALVARKVDLLGFIFVESSPRKTTPEFVASLGDLNSSRSVGVFMDPSLNMVEEVVDIARLSCVQLHGSESGEFCAALKHRLPHVEILKAFSTDWANIPFVEYEVCNALLFDSGKGSGKTFDWDLLPSVPQYQGDIFLAGGIGPENIQEAKRFVQSRGFTGIDINSRVETAPGKKSIEKIDEVLCELKSE